MSERVGGVLKYHVAHCSSEDEEYPASELHASYNEHCRGWQTSRLCEYPQTLVVQFEGEVRIRKIKFLSHEFKISQKIELFIGLLDTDAAGVKSDVSFSTCSFKRIGFLSLSTNVENDFNARELKRVKLDVTCCFMKMKFHANHVNSKNIYNQIGLIGVQFIGEMVTPFPAKVLKPIAEIQRTNSKTIDLEELNPNKNLVHNIDEFPMDEETKNQIEELNILKIKAVHNEDFIRAQQIKDQIENLKKSAAQLAELEKQKKLAVDREEFAKAHKLKQQIEQIRESTKQQFAEAEDPPVQRSSSQADERRVVRSRGNKRRSAPTTPREREERPIKEVEPEEAMPRPKQVEVHEAREIAEPATSNIPYDERPIKGKAMAVQMFAEEQPPVIEKMKRKRPNKNDVQLVAPEDPAEQPIRKKQDPKNHDEVPVKALSKNDAMNEEYPEEKVSRTEVSISESVEHVLSRKEDWERALIKRIVSESANGNLPEPLPKNDDFSDLVRVFGDFTTQCLLSQKSRSYREAAVKVLTDYLEELPADKTSILAAVFRFLKRGINDKIPSIYHACLVLLKQAIRVCGKSVKKTSIPAATTDAVISALMSKLADTNTRIRDAAMKTLITLCGKSCVGQAAVCLNSMKIPKSESGWKPIVGRMQLLVQLVPKYGFTEKSGMSSTNVLAFVAKGLEHPHIDPRRAAIELFVEVHRLDPAKANNFAQSYNEKKPALYKEMATAIQTSAQPKVPVTSQEFAEEAPPKQPKSKKSKRQAEKQQEVHEEHHDGYEFENLDPAQMKECQFCGEMMPNGDYEQWHWLFYCKLLTNCPLCNMVVEIEALNSHMLTSCAKKESVFMCETCGEAVIHSEADLHHSSGQCTHLGEGTAIKCPLCKEDMPDEQAFFQHLAYQCQCNDKPNPKEQDPEFDLAYQAWIQFRNEHYQ